MADDHDYVIYECDECLYRSLSGIGVCPNCAEHERQALLCDPDREWTMKWNAIRLAPITERDEAREALGQVVAALDGLYDTYKPEGVGIWLKGAKRQFDGRSPLELICAGEVQRVADAVEQMRSGAAT